MQNGRTYPCQEERDSVSISRSHAGEGDPYGISEYTSQSFVEASSPMRDSSLDVRGNAVLKPRGIPTQEECDAIKAQP